MTDKKIIIVLGMIIIFFFINYGTGYVRDDGPSGIIILKNDTGTYAFWNGQIIIEGVNDTQTMQDAINKVHTNGKITMMEGDYNMCNIRITKSLSIEGVGEGTIGSPRWLLSCNDSILTVGDYDRNLRIGNVGIKGIYMHANHKNVTNFLNISKANDIKISGSWIWGSDGNIKNIINIKDVWTLIIEDSPIEGNGVIHSDIRDVNKGDKQIFITFDKDNIRVGFNGDSDMSGWNIVNSDIFGCFNLNAKKGMRIYNSKIGCSGSNSNSTMFDNINGFILKDNIIDIGSVKTIFKFSSHSDGATITGNTFINQIPPNIFDSYDPNKKINKLIFNDNIGLDPFYWDIKTNDKGQVLLSFKDNIAIANKPMFIINTERDYYAYISSWQYIDGYIKGSIIQLANSTGNASADIPVRVKAILN